MSTKKEKDLEKVKEKIDLLMKKASLEKDLSKAKKYVRKARVLAMKYRISMKKYRIRICRHCKAFLVPSLNCRIRIHKSRIIYKCLECNNFMRFPFK